MFHIDGARAEWKGRGSTGKGVSMKDARPWPWPLRPIFGLSLIGSSLGLDVVSRGLPNILGMGTERQDCKGRGSEISVSKGEEWMRERRGRKFQFRRG